MNSVVVGMNTVVVGMNSDVVGMNSVPVAHVNCCSIAYLYYLCSCYLCNTGVAVGDVTTWSNRLQDILGKDLEKGLVDYRDMNSMLHAMLWRGLRQELKDISGHKHHIFFNILSL
jgi:hypothetical protein